jgi:hypothetical protein
LTLPTSAFPSVHIVGSLISKLRSIIYTTESAVLSNGSELLGYCPTVVCYISFGRSSNAAFKQLFVWLGKCSLAERSCKY